MNFRAASSRSVPRKPAVAAPMALPIWAHHRGKTYGYIAMGGKCEPNCKEDFQGSPSDDDTTVAYHGPVSSTEPYYCSPSGWRTQTMGGVDVVRRQFDQRLVAEALYPVVQAKA